MTPAGDLTTRLLTWLKPEQAGLDLVAYFREPTTAADTSIFSGRHFERLGGGGDHPSIANRFTAEDLIAVQTLSIAVPPEASVAILHGHLGRQLADRLASIPNGISLSDPAAGAEVADGSPAKEAWDLLNDTTGIGWVTAGKLLARKRPHLIPVYDQVVSCALGSPRQFWRSLHATLSAPDSAVRSRIEELRQFAPCTVSDLRILDVVVWMGHRRDHANC
ncbi:MAG: DUF6308 family protein [Actinomycetia bacterium]|nr:DUF6308 family protein [Actinomycetes bacterium]